MFLDIFKAFDSFDSDIVVEEAKVMSARPFVLRMFASFHFKRSQLLTP